jgi:hypothetical protein
MSLSNLKSQISNLLILLAATSASAGTVTGVVRNGTTGTVVTGQDVVLIQLQGGMETVANTKTDAQGRYTLEHSSVGQAPVLIRVNYRGVNFHQPVPPGRGVADVEVFEPTTDPAAAEIVSRAIIFQPNGPSLLVGEEYSIHNHTKPPRAYFKNDSTFEFEVPEGAQLGQVSAWGPSGMPVQQGTIDKAKNRYAIIFPFRPGENGVRLAYQLPYPNDAAALTVLELNPAQRVSLIAPPTMQVRAEGFAPGGTDQGWNIYSRENVPAGTKIAISVSGTAPPMTADGAQQSGDASPAADVSLSQLPGRLDNLKWPMIGGFSALFALGLIFLWRRPVVPAVVKPSNGAAPARTAKAPKASKAAVIMAEVQQQASHSLDEIKENLFRLELRHQAGTISEEDYTRERARAEKYLHDILQG